MAPPLTSGGLTAIADYLDHSLNSGSPDESLDRRRDRRDWPAADPAPQRESHCFRAGPFAGVIARGRRLGCGTCRRRCARRRVGKLAVVRIRPDAVINELTSLPRHYTPAEMSAAAERDRKVRTEGNANLSLAAIQDAGVRRYILQSSGFAYAAGTGLADEVAELAFDASPEVAAGARRTPRSRRRRRAKRTLNS